MEAASRWVDMLSSMNVAKKTADWVLRSWVLERGNMVFLVAVKRLRMGILYHISHHQIEHPSMTHCRSYPPTATLGSFTKFCNTSLF